jgi:hypothetical protein
VFDFCFQLVEAGLVLELPVLRLEFSQFLIVFPWWILDHTKKVFDEMRVRLFES